MVRRKIDSRIRVMIENGVATRHRSMFVVVGDQGKDQVVVLHHMLSKAELKARPSVLWCYKKELGFSSHPRKRMKELQKKIKSGKLSVREDDPFELFISATNIRYCYYAETHKILGNTYGMCVLQDFEALTPNLLARTIETVEGGGIIVILLRTMSSLKQLFTMSMDVHSRFRTEAHQDVVGRFNERFLLSLASCENCVVVDDKLHLIPVSTHALTIEPLPPKSLDETSPQEVELEELKTSIQEMDVTTGKIIKMCRTLDQAHAFLKFVDAIVEKTLRSTVVMTAARGRGKSAALGLAMAAAVGFGYSNIFVTAPSPENLKTLFEFIFKGFDTLDYQEHIDYEIIQSTNPDLNKAVVRVNIFRDHRQTIQYIHPSDSNKLGQAELVCIDEAAAIPLPLVKSLLGPYLVFMSSTVNGYEGTGRSLSLKLVQQLRQQSSTYGGSVKEARLAANMVKQGIDTSASGRVLHEIELKESIRYANGDPVEAWLNRLLCLDASSVPRSVSGCPLPATCQLYYVNRDTLFSYHPASEKFLHRIMALYVSSHLQGENSPNDLQLLSDAPAHHIFVLLGPVVPSQGELPEVLCVLQVSLEGEISKSTIISSLQRGKRASGDLIPWTVSQQYQDQDFPGLSGARTVRIATHPDYQGMGYGTRALEQLQQYYEGRFPNLKETEEMDHDDSNDGDEDEKGVTEIDDENLTLLSEQIQPRKNLPPLLVKLTDRRPEHLDYLGVSYGLTSDLFRFWKKAGYVPVYLRQTANELTGEHSCIMLKTLNTSNEDQERQAWLGAFWKDFQKRFVALLSYQFRVFKPSVALNVLQNKTYKSSGSGGLSKSELLMYFTTYDIQRLELYSSNMVDYHLIVDLLPELARQFFIGRIPVHLSAVQSSVLLSLGLQHKTVDEVEKEVDLPANQILALFNRSIHKFVQHFNGILEKDAEVFIAEKKDVVMDPLKQTMDQELNEAGKEFKEQHKRDVASIMGSDLSQYAIRGSETEWKEALKGTGKSVISVKSHLAEKKRKLISEMDQEPFADKKNKKKHKKIKKGVQ